MQENFSDFRFIFFDLETTGLDIYQAKILEIALIGPSGEEMLHSYVQYPFEITNSEIHGITQEVLQKNNARILLEVLKDMEACIEAKFINQTEPVYLVAYNNMNYDKLILEMSYHRLGRKMPNNWYFMDPYPQFKEMLSLPSLKLTSVYQHYFQTELINAHNALSDTRGLYQVYQAFFNEKFIQQANLNTIIPLVNFTENGWWNNTDWRQMAKTLFCNYLMSNPLFTQVNIFHHNALYQKIETLGITGTCLRILKERGYTEVKDLLILYLVVYPNFEEIIKKRTGLTSVYIIGKLTNAMKYIVFLLYNMSDKNDSDEKLQEVRQKIKILD